MHIYLTVLAHTRCGQCQSLHVLGFHDSLARWKSENTTEAPVSKPSMLVLPRIPSLPPGAMRNPPVLKIVLLVAELSFQAQVTVQKKNFCCHCLDCSCHSWFWSSLISKPAWTESHYITSLTSKISTILMSQRLECQDYRCEPPCPSKLFCLFREDSL